MGRYNLLLFIAGNFLPIPKVVKLVSDSVKEVYFTMKKPVSPV